MSQVVRGDIGMFINAIQNDAGEQSGVPALEAPIQFATGVGPQRARLFAKLGVATCGDMLNYYPRDYVQFQGHIRVSELRPGQHATVQGRIIQTRLIRRRPMRFEALLEEESGRCVLIWFNRHDLSGKIMLGISLRATGAVNIYNGRPQLLQPRFEPVDRDSAAGAAPCLEPLYGAIADLPSGAIHRIITGNLDRLLAHVAEWFEPAFLAERNLFPLRRALEQIHRPLDFIAAGQARRTLAYHEFFLYQLAVGIKRYHQKNLVGAMPLRTDDIVDARIRALLDFTLTAAQDRVISQFRRDLAKNRPMNRLLQGDVGSGKTVVALYAMLLAVASGSQAAMLAPTGVLAEQHLLTLERYLSRSRVKIGLLTAGVAATERRAVLAVLADGSLDILIGTHALLQDDIRFKKLALLVVDEQHKFGVRQRAVIRDRYAGVHTLIMTATPIPRTLAMTLFGDLDVSTIDELPPGRRPVVTRRVAGTRRAEVYEFVRGRLAQGRQAYVVAPAVDENTSELQNVVQLHRELQSLLLKDYRVGLLHGRIPGDRRRQVMDDFRNGRIHALVCTTVIEVGVDVPNATLMIVEHADHFGLAQLHQLRGRIGRGAHQSLCVLISDQPTDQSFSRLDAMVKYAGGFKIAEEDLKLRGMGELIGTRQSGHPDFHFTDLLFDPVLLPLARRDALAVVAADPHLIAPSHAVLRHEALRRFGRAIALADVG